MSITSNAKLHLYSIDLLKGFLLVWVIIGHVLQGSMADSAPRYMIYGFHMPVFVAVTGYLINFEKLKSGKFQEIAVKYLYRVVIPWVLAVVAYYLFSNHNHVTLSGFINRIIQPFYHLWYIPSMLLFILITWLLSKTHLSFKAILIGSLIVSIGAYFINLTPHLINSLNFGGAIRPQFYFFFCLGMYLKNSNLLMGLRTAVYIAIGVSLAIYIYCFYNPDAVLQTISFFGLNISLLIFTFGNIASSKIPRVAILEWMGVNSLPIYLWHVMPILMLKTIQTVSSNQFLFYALCLVIEILVLLIVKLCTRVKVINEVAFGGK